MVGGPLRSRTGRWSLGRADRGGPAASVATARPSGRGRRARPRARRESDTKFGANGHDPPPRSRACTAAQRVVGESELERERTRRRAASPAVAQFAEYPNEPLAARRAGDGSRGGRRGGLGDRREGRRGDCATTGSSAARADDLEHARAVRGDRARRRARARARRRPGRARAARRAHGVGGGASRSAAASGGARRDGDAVRGNALAYRGRGCVVPRSSGARRGAARSVVEGLEAREVVAHARTSSVFDMARHEPSARRARRSP